MNPRYEYKFVRLGKGWFSVRKSALNEYQDLVHWHAKKGWRLVQVFAPGIGVYGTSRYLELIFEREVSGNES